MRDARFESRITNPASRIAYPASRIAHPASRLSRSPRGVLAFTTTVALAETSRFDDLANAAFTENRPTKKTAPTEAYYDKSWRLLDIERVKW